ncbi:MAG: hypothetical protein FD119_3275 [Stygiobacter sp.]|nr:MAG: hypothetical protein FD119_3275 [Stygiobacter sp.]
MKPNYIPLGIDRFLMALMVFFSHTTGLAYLHQDIAYFGALGVLLFFSVSGYIVFYSYFTFYDGSPFRFLTNRALRIYPTLWASLVLAIALCATTPGLAKISANVSLEIPCWRSSCFERSASFHDAVCDDQQLAGDGDEHHLG